MRKDIGETISRTLRQEFEAGKKYSTGADFDWLEPHFFALTKVVLPGKKNSRLLIEMTPKQLNTLIEQERADQEKTVIEKYAEERKLKSRKVKQLKTELQQKEELIASLQDTAAKAVRRTRKIEKELEEKLKENTELWNENEMGNLQQEEAASKAASAKAKISEQAARIAALEELTKRQQVAMIAHNVSSGDKEDRSFNTPSTALEQSHIKVTSNKPLEGSYGSNQ